MTSNSDAVLRQLSGQINAAHTAVCSHAAAGLGKAIEAGRLLRQAKDAVAHGEWLPWLSANCTISQRTAQAYMQLAGRYGEEANAQRIAHLTLREALHAVAISRRQDILASVPGARGEELADREEWQTETAAELAQLSDRADVTEDPDELQTIIARCDALVVEGVETRLRSERQLAELLAKQKTIETAPPGDNEIHIWRKRLEMDHPEQAYLAAWRVPDLPAPYCYTVAQFNLRDGFIDELTNPAAWGEWVRDYAHSLGLTCLSICADPDIGGPLIAACAA